MAKMDHKALCHRVTHSFLGGDDEETVCSEIESGVLDPEGFFRIASALANTEGGIEDEEVNPSEFLESALGPRFQLIPESSTINLFDIIHPRTKPDISLYGLYPHFTPSPEDLKRIDANFWVRTPDLRNSLYIPKYVVAGLQLIVKRSTLPFWMKPIANKASNTFKLVLGVLNLLFEARNHGVGPEIVSELAGVINTRYVTESALPALDKLLRTKI